MPSSVLPSGPRVCPAPGSRIPFPDPKSLLGPQPNLAGPPHLTLTSTRAHTLRKPQRSLTDKFPTTGLPCELCIRVKAQQRPSARGRGEGGWGINTPPSPALGVGGQFSGVVHGLCSVPSSRGTPLPTVALRPVTAPGSLKKPAVALTAYRTKHRFHCLAFSLLVTCPLTTFSGFLLPSVNQTKLLTLPLASPTSFC